MDVRGHLTTSFSPPQKGQMVSEERGQVTQGGCGDALMRNFIYCSSVWIE